MLFYQTAAIFARAIRKKFTEKSTLSRFCNREGVPCFSRVPGLKLMTLPVTGGSFLSLNAEALFQCVLEDAGKAEICL